MVGSRQTSNHFDRSAAVAVRSLVSAASAASDDGRKMRAKNWTKPSVSMTKPAEVPLGAVEAAAVVVVEAAMAVAAAAAGPAAAVAVAAAGAVAAASAATDDVVAAAESSVAGTTSAASASSNIDCSFDWSAAASTAAPGASFTLNVALSVRRSRTWVALRVRVRVKAGSGMESGEKMRVGGWC